MRVGIGARVCATNPYFGVGSDGLRHEPLLRNVLLLFLYEPLSARESVTLATRTPTPVLSPYVRVHVQHDLISRATVSGEVWVWVSRAEAAYMVMPIIIPMVMPRGTLS